MKNTNHPKKTIRMALAVILSVSMIIGLSATTAIAAGSDAANENLKALGRHLAGIEEIADAKKLDAANLTGDASVNSQSLVRWARALLRPDNSPDLTIKKEKTVTDGTYHDVTIDASVGDGTVILDGVTITGQLIVQGGGSHSVKVKNCEVKSVVLDKDTSNGSEAPRLELTGTEVKTVEVAKPAIIEAKDTASKVETLSAKDDVTIKGKETKVQNVTVPTEAKENVKLTVNDAAVEKVDVNKAVTIETNAAMGKTPVQNVEAKANVTVTGAATNVGTVTVNTGTENGVTLTVTDAKVKNVSAVTPVTIKANEKASKIENVEAKDDVTVVGSTKIDTITVPEKLDTTPEITVTAGSVNTVKADGKAKVSGTAANAITNVEAAASVEVASTAVAKVTVVNVTVSVTVNGSSTDTSTVEVAVEVETTGNETVAIETKNNVTVNVSTHKEETPAVKVNDTKVGHVHKWVESGRKEADCTTNGYIDYKCTTCSETKRETIPAKGHVEVVIPAVEPTCTAAGSTAGKKCAVCSTEGQPYIVKPQPVNVLAEHTYGEWIAEVSADGTTDGVKGHYHCAVCGKNFDAQKTELTDLRIPAPIAVVTTEDAFCAALKDTSRIGVKVSGNITLSADTTIPADKTVEITVGKTVEIVSGKTLTLQGSLRVYGTLTNHGTISGSGMNVEVYGGKLENEGTIDLNGALLTIEKGAVLNNFVGDIKTAKISGTINAEINFVDYYCADQDYLCQWNVVEDDHTLDIDGEHKMVIAAVFDTDKISTALNKTVPITVTGEDGPVSIDVCKYNAVLLSGTEEAGTVHLGGLTVPERMMLILKDSVFDGTNTYHNTYVVDNDAELTVAPGGMLISRGGASLTVASGSKLTANGYMALETLTVNGHVYTEEGGLDVTTALTVNAGGTLEVGSGSSLNYWGENNATINGTIIETIRYVNGFEESVTSTIEGNGVTSNKTLTTLAFDDNVVLTGKHTVDTVVAYSGSLRVAPGGSLKYKEVHCEEGFTGRIIGPTTGPDGNGYTTLIAKATGVSTYADLVAALKDGDVTYVTVDADITVPSGNEWTQLDITKPVVIADDCTFTVAHYAGNAPQSQLIMNEIVIKDGGSLTLGEGATLTATEKRSGDNEMFYRYFGRIYVDYGGVLDVSHGNVTDGSAIYYNYGEENSNRIIVGENNIPDNIAFEVHNEEQLRGAMADPKCTGGIEADMDIELTKDLTVEKYLLINDYQKLIVPENVTLTVPAEKELQVSGQLYVYGGTVINHGTIYGFDIIDVIGGALENDGAIEGMYGPNDRGDIVCTSLLVVEDGGVLNNYTTDTASTGKPGTIHDAINFVDYWYTGEPTKFTKWNVLAGDTTLNIDGDSRAVIAVASSQQVQTALDKTVTWGNETETHSATKYTVVMATGTTPENGTVTLSNLTVNPYQTLLLKERVDVGNTTYHNATYNLSKISFGKGAGLAIKGAPTVNIGENVNYNYLIANEGAVISGNGYVHSAEQLMAALQNGGDIYLYPYDRKDIEPVIFEYEDGHTETVYETQYRIASDEPYAISKDTNLISLGGGDPMAVFFDGGFTVANGTTLKFNGLNVVAAKDSSVGGRVEVCNGILVVQANSEAGAALTNLGTIQVGNPNCDGKLAIFPKLGENGEPMFENAEQIVNNGRIERFGDIIAWDIWHDTNFTGNEPLEFVTFRDLVCDLNRDFGNMPNLEPVDFERKDEQEHVIDLAGLYAYPDGGSQFFDEEYPDKSDFDAIGAFGMLINSGVIPEYNAQISPRLNPWHYVTKAEVKELFTAFAKKVLGRENVTLDISADDGLLCCTDNIPVEDGGNSWYTSERTQCFDALREALRPLTERNVKTEADFLNALDIPYVTEIHVTGNITLNGCCYQDGQRVSAAAAHNDENAVYLWGAGNDRNGERKIIVEPGVTLTVNSGVKMDIQPGVELCLDNNGAGKLVLEKGSGLNVFGGLKPDNWNEEFGDDDNRQRKYVIQNEGSYINFFPDVMEFTKRLGERMGNRIAPATDEDIAGYTNLANEWPGGDDRVRYFAALVKYDTLQPRTEGEGDGSRKVWRPYDKVQYNEAMNILDNLWKDLFKNETMPAGICLDDVGRPEEWLDDDRVDRLLDLFEKAVQAKASGAVMVGSINELTAALPKGGDIYLLPFAKEYRHQEVFTFEDGHKETVYETQYRIAANTTISKYTNLISLGGGDPMAVFFVGGFTVAEGTTLKFNGLNVVAAADSSVGGRVEAHNGELIVQTQSAALATLTISSTGVVVIGAPEEHGALAIYNKQYGENLFYTNNKIVNNGRIENYGELKFALDQSEGQFAGNQPIVPKEEISGDATLTIQRDKGQDKTFIFMNNKQDPLGGDMIKNVQFNGPVTIVCDTSQLSGDKFGGDIRFKNCEFTQGVDVQMAAGIGYNIRLDGCTGSFTVTAETDAIKAAKDTGVNFFGSSLTVNGLTIEGMPGWESDDGINVRYDECGNNGGVKSYISTVEVVNRRDNTVFISGNYSDKLRIGGNIDISGVSLGTNGRIELANDRRRSDIKLGSNEITVCDDCSGEYSFTGSGTVIVPNQNSNAHITVNDVDLGTPHIFGDYDDFGIFFPVSSGDGVDFTVEQGQWNDKNQCVVGWAELTSFEVQYKQDGGCNLGQQEGEDWISNPYQVRVTAEVTDGCTVVYDPIMWKPIQVGEFVELLNRELGKNYALSAIHSELNGEDYLTFGTAKTILTYVWNDFSEEETDFHAVINDDNYWNQLERWKNDNDPNKGDSLDNWTRSWNDARDMVHRLKNALGIRGQSQEEAINGNVNDSGENTPDSTPVQEDQNGEINDEPET